MGLFARDIGIDLGTANTLVCMRREGIILREPSVVAVNQNTGKVCAVGSEAKEMIGKTPGSIVAFRPLKDGVIADYDVTAAMLKRFCRKAQGHKLFFSRPRIVVCIPYGVTGVEKRAVEGAILDSGARSTYLIEEPLAAAIGAGLPVGEATGTMVVDIGGGTSEVAVVSLGGIVVSQSVRTAGDNFDEAIVAYVKKTYNLLIGERTAESIKMTIGAAHESMADGEMDIRGRNLINGLPVTLTVTGREILEAIREPVGVVVDAIKNTLEKTPPELSADIYERGIMLTGGGAKLAGLNILISEQTGVEVHIAENPLDCVVNGIAAVLDNLDEYAGMLLN